VLIGILADSHGSVVRLNRGIEALGERGADALIHLGDIADTLRLDTVDDCIELLIRNNIAGVMGNHEYSLVMHHFKRYPERFSETTMEYVCSLPRRLVLCDICFTHFSDGDGVYGLFGPTDERSYEEILRNSSWSVLVNGHSHDPRIYRRLNGVVENIVCDVGQPFELEEEASYILTCGALDDWYCALLDMNVRTFEVVSLHDRRTGGA